MKLKNNIFNNIFDFFLFFSIILSVLYIWAFSSNFPVADQWIIIKHLSKVDPTYLWAKHNEHIIFFPKLIFIALAQITHWNILFEIYLSWTIFVVMIGFLYLTLIRNNLDNIRRAYVTSILILFCTPVHYQNWLWGWQLQIVLSVLCSIIALYLTSTLLVLDDKPMLRLIKCFGIVISLVISAFSFSSGLVAALVVVGTVLFLFLQKRVNFSVFLIVTLSFLLLLFPYLSASVQKAGCNFNLFKAFIYFIGYLGVLFSSARVGAPLVFLKAAEIVGIMFGVLFLIITGIVLLGNYKKIKIFENQKCLYVLILMLFSALVGVLLAFGREGFGLSAFLTSRYRIFSLLFVLGLSDLAFIDKNIRGLLSGQGLRYSLVCLLAVLFIFNWGMGTVIGKAWKDKYQILKDYVNAPEIGIYKRIPSEYYGGISKAALDEDIAILKKQKWSLFNK